MIKIVASSSSGNCYRYFNLLIDVGIGYEKLKREVKLKEINLVLLTHEHGDHFKISTIKSIHDNFPHIKFIVPFYLADKIPVDISKIITIDYGQKITFKGFSVQSVKLYHDVPNVGYSLDFDGYRVFHATDTAHLKGISAKGYDYYGIEYNYSQKRFEEQKNIEYEYGTEEHTKQWLFNRSANSHLSDEQHNLFVEENNTKNGVVKRYHCSKDRL